MKMFDLTGKVAIVTGASSGLGVQFAEVLAQAGADVAIMARRVDRLEALKERITGMGRKCLAYGCDVSKEEDICKAMASVEKDFGKIDILVNNAGVVTPGASEQYKAEDWDWVMNVNTRAVFIASREALKVMLKHNYGKIINIASVAGILGGPNNVSYHTSKAAVVNMTRSLAGEYATRGITVNAIAPAVFASEMTEGFFGGGEVSDEAAGRTPAGRIGKPGELNGALIYFASDASSYTSGQTLAVDGGWTAIL